MPVRIVQSKQNARLKLLRRALSHPGREAGAAAGIEGPNLIEEALRAGIEVETVFAAEGSEALLEGLGLAEETEILLMPREVLLSALATETPQPVAALVRPPAWQWRDLTEGGRTPLILLLAGLQDPGNVGTILRSAEAFGASGAVSLPGTVSAWNPKAVRASAGSLFRLPLMEASPDQCFRRLAEAGIAVWTTAMEGARQIDRADLAAPVAILIGNEGNGVPPELARQAQGALTIPCPGPVESLNAAVAASVLLYEASRQRARERKPR